MFGRQGSRFDEDGDRSWSLDGQEEINHVGCSEAEREVSSVMPIEGFVDFGDCAIVDSGFLPYIKFLNFILFLESMLSFLLSLQNLK